MLAAAPALAGRPLETEDTDVRPSGSVEFEISTDYTRAGEDERTVEAIGLALGLGHYAELGIGTTVTLDPGDGTGERGLGDAELALEYLIVDDRRHGVDIALTPGVRLPTGDDSRGHGDPGFDVSLGAAIGASVGAATIFSRAGYTFVTADPGESAWQLALAAEYALSDGWTLVAEIDATVGGREKREPESQAFVAARRGVPLGALSTDPGRRASTDQAEARLGMTFALTDRVTIDGALALGLHGAAPELGSTLGITWRAR